MRKRYELVMMRVVVDIDTTQTAILTTPAKALHDISEVDCKENTSGNEIKNMVGWQQQMSIWGVLFLNTYDAARRILVIRNL